MSNNYNPPKTYNLYSVESAKPFRLSRSKIDLFLRCPRCFYLDCKLGIGQPPGYPFTLNSAIDKLLKKEFDIHRANGTKHPLCEKYAIDAIPLSHEKINEWRDALKGGITFRLDGTNIVITGGIDDLWVNPEGEYIVVDYKATAKEGDITLDADWQIGYKRQMEIYQWLFRKNGFKVSNTGYFVYCNGNTDKEAFDGRLEFEVKIIPYTGDTFWVEDTILDAIECLKADRLPAPGLDCDFCKYRKAVRQAMSQFE
ncbi:MAG TPA: PD-(D/E)XK nuclease family protein [Candidatus Deferrimicrobium sp.]|nr:PD-(D/E)XK nuclease family protein [Candidatus Deferrimicrobium sp.]